MRWGNGGDEGELYGHTRTLPREDEKIKMFYDVYVILCLLHI
jgi:hypothetical protein